MSEGLICTSTPMVGLQSKFPNPKPLKSAKLVVRIYALHITVYQSGSEVTSFALSPCVLSRVITAKLVRWKP